MAQIVINEVSQNYSYAIGSNSYATVAMPIMSCWGPGYFNGATYLPLKKETQDDYAAAANLMLEQTTWKHYPATQEGLEAYVSDYRGPIANYRLAQDYSYYVGMTLMTAGYDLLVCRLCPGACAKTSLTLSTTKNLGITAKYPGTFGNNLRVKFIKQKMKYQGEDVYYWNCIVYVFDKNTRIQTAVENKTFYFNIENSYKFGDAVPHISEIDSNFLQFSYDEVTDDDFTITSPALTKGEDKYSLEGGTDTLGDEDAKIDGTSPATALQFAAARYRYFDSYYEASEVELDEGGTALNASVPGKLVYLQALAELQNDQTKKTILRTREWVFSSLVDVTFGKEEKEGADLDVVVLGGVLDLLTDKLSYNPNRLVLPSWDDQDLKYLGSDDYINKKDLSPLHLKLMQTAYASRCATAYLDLPRSLRRRDVHIEDEDPENTGYVQTLADQMYSLGDLDNNSSLYTSHSAIFGPWAQYRYIGVSAMKLAGPGFLALMIQRAQIKNQSIQYEWALPTNRKHTLKIGKAEYNVPKKLLDKWQKIEGVSVNVLTTIPDLGTNIWGNSTLFNVPPATYQALANLSTRWLFNAIEDQVFRVGISITFQYNNQSAYDAFYVGCTPILETMRNVGAVIDYRIIMSADIRALDRVNYNAVIGKIYLKIAGVINDITVDLVALPPDSSLDEYAAL